MPMYIRTAEQVTNRHSSDGSVHVVIESMVLDASLDVVRTLYRLSSEMHWHAIAKMIERTPSEIGCQVYRRVRPDDNSATRDDGAVGLVIPRGLKKVRKDEASLRFSATGAIRLDIAEDGDKSSTLLVHGIVSSRAIIQCLLLQVPECERVEIIRTLTARNPKRLLNAIENPVVLEPEAAGLIETNLMAILGPQDLAPLLQSDDHEARVRARLLFGADRTSTLRPDAGEARRSGRRTNKKPRR